MDDNAIYNSDFLSSHLLHSHEIEVATNNIFFMGSPCSALRFFIHIYDSILLPTFLFHVVISLHMQFELCQVKTIPSLHSRIVHQSVYE